MESGRVSVFFYGSFINLKVLEEGGLHPEKVEVARLSGYDIRIRPLANVEASSQHCVYGILCRATHAQLSRLYGQDWVGDYLPYPVLAETLEGKLAPALCYIAPSPKLSQAADDYVGRIVDPAREHGFPDWYIERLESFRPAS